MVSRYSKNDWENSNNTIYHLSEKERKLAERLRSDAFQAIKATDQRTRNRQSSNTKRLGQWDNYKSPKKAAEALYGASIYGGAELEHNSSFT